MHRLLILLTVSIVFITSNFLAAQTTGWEELNKKLESLATDSARIIAHYQVASQTYLSTPQQAKEIVDKGLTLVQQTKLEELKIDLLNLRGVIDLKLNNFDESVKTHFGVLKMREQRGDKKGMMLSLLNIGNVFNKSYDPDQAAQYYEKALAIAKEINDDRNRVNIELNIGNIYAQKALNEDGSRYVDKAIDFITKTVAFCKKNAPDVTLYNSYILLSYLYLKVDDLKNSERYTDLAITITERHKDPVGIAYARINRANIFVKKKAFDLAEKEVKIIKGVIAKSDLKYLEEELQGDFDKIAKAVKEKKHDLILTDRDSIDREETREAEAQRLLIREELREKYESEKKELENKNLLLEKTAIERESDRVKLLWVATFAILLTFSFMLILLIRKNRLLRNEKHKVEVQAQEIKQQHTELVQADRFRTRIFSMVSHDLRMPLANFQSLLALSKIMDLPSDKIKSMLLRIGQEVGTASKMLDELLVWSSQQMSSEKLEIQSIHVTQIVEQCRDLFADRLKLKDLNLEIDLQPSLTVKGDLKRFEFIVRNILNNAIKFSFIGKSILVGQEERNGELILSFTDQGIGMDEEKIAQLKKKDLQESYQGTMDEKGAGIGLILCHEFANRMGWTIEIISAPDLGSTFAVHIPLLLHHGSRS